MIGGTAHTFQDCKILISKDIDYIVLSSFRIMNTSTDLSQPLGLSGYTSIAEVLSTETPIIGIGGITTIDVKAILKTGISGIAVSEAITQNFDVIREFHQLLNASATAEQRHTFK